ncbi:MAG TPA: ThiF family adenylyltransferase, partial [Isosphaeraceae bacterium]|nr:ThiF family adenylyltransferase [Isosphaeraceae bacterium]
MSQHEQISKQRDRVASGQDVRLLDHPELGEAGVARLQTGGPVAVVGVGTVGARVAHSLCAPGIPLLLVDQGEVEPANVGLQPYDQSDVGVPKAEALGRRLLAIRPDMSITSFVCDVRRLGPRVLFNCRLLIGAIDSFRDRVWLAQLATHLGIPLLDLALDGTGRSLFGRASGFDAAHGSSCYTCGWDAEIWDMVSREEGGSACAALAAARPMINPSTRRSEAPATLALPGLAEVIAGLGTIQAVRLLLGTARDRVIDRECRIDLTSGQFSESVRTRDPRCRSSHERWTIGLLDHTPLEQTLGSLMEEAGRMLGGEVTLGVPDEPFVLEAACSACKRKMETFFLARALPACPHCQGPLVPLLTGLRAQVGERDVAFARDRSWAELGVPLGGAVRACNDKGEERVYLFAAGKDPASQADGL